MGDFNRGIRIDSIFEDAPDFLEGDFGYITIYSEYGGLSCYTLIENANGSKTVDHGF
jgi:hypothetical protein